MKEKEFKYDLETSGLSNRLNGEPLTEMKCEKKKFCLENLMGLVKNDKLLGIK